MGAYEQGGESQPPVARAPHVSWLRKVLNIIGCLLSLPLYWLMTVHCRYPVTLDLIVTILLTELNRFNNEGRRIRLYEEESPAPRKSIDFEKSDPELQPAVPRLDCLAAVVGWREDPGLFTRALESYKAAKCCKFLLVGIDGDEAEDMDMVSVFNQVYPDRSKTIRIPQPLGEVAEQVRSKVLQMRSQSGEQITSAECDQIAMRHCVELVKAILDQEDIRFGGHDGVRQLCIRQKHMHKKGIMFTAFIFSLVIADRLGVEFMWSSDSDTLVFPDSLQRTVDSIAIDPKVGGASSGLIVHNQHESAITNLASTVYWGELYLTRSTPAATATSDCQSGPSTVFRLAALPDILVPWYLQTIMNKRMIINEDRHLTTNLLTRGWGVVFASDVLTATDSPTTLARWLMQQVRWARATHIESLLQPRVYLMSHPLLFYGMAKREFGPVIAFFAICYYCLTARQLIVVSVFDLCLRVLVSSGYNLLRNPHRLGRLSLRWVVPGILFYHIPLPAVHVWSMLTLTADGWGTSMRASGERQKKDSVRQAWWETGFFVAWMAVVAGVAVRWFAGWYGLGSGEELLAMAVCMAAAAFAGWKTTIDKITS